MRPKLPLYHYLLQAAYQDKYGVDEQRIVHMTNNEILLLNPNLQNKNGQEELVKLKNINKKL